MRHRLQFFALTPTSTSRAAL